MIIGQPIRNLSLKYSLGAQQFNKRYMIMATAITNTHAE